MSPLGAHWKHKVAGALGLDVVAPFTLQLPNGRMIAADALVKNFGYRNGMLLFDDYDRIAPVRDRLVEMEYGYSVLSAPSAADEVELDIYREILSDWTWSGPANAKPAWIADEL